MAAYHGRSFVGNDCNKYLKENVYTDITSQAVHCVQELTSNAEIIEEAYEIKDQFDNINQCYSSVHKKVAHDKFIPDEATHEIGVAIQAYMRAYRNSFPNTNIIPKQHILEDHILPWIKNWHFGLGFHGEQGGESIHSAFNTIQRRMRNPNPLHKLVNAMKEHHAQVHPALQQEEPEIKRRPKKRLFFDCN